MTWIVGYRSLDFACLFGDIRITGPSGPVTKFGVQKVHAVAPNVILGFAGGIKIGFSAAAAFARAFADRGPIDLRTEVHKVAKAIQGDYAEVVPKAERAHGCHLLVASTGPTPWRPENAVGYVPGEYASCGFKVMLPRPHERVVHVEEMPHQGASSIGSGSTIDAYVRAVSSYDPNFLLSIGQMAAQTGPQGIFFINTLLGRAFAEAVKATPEPTVADQVIAAAVIRNEIAFQTNYDIVSETDGVVTHDVEPFPPIARNMTELLELADHHGLGKLTGHLIG